jgi:hypothetical protein
MAVSHSLLLKSRRVPVQNLSCDSPDLAHTVNNIRRAANVGGMRADPEFV